MLKLKCTILLIINKVFKTLNISTYFESYYGIKSFNQPLKSHLFEVFPQLNHICLKPYELFIGFDGLNDFYSLVDIPIINSPHKHLMETLETNGNYYSTDYYNRSLRGKLDGRFEYIFQIKSIYSKFKAKKKQILNNTHAEVIVCNIKNKYYIVDGKHTAALCCLLGVEIRCIEIQNPFLDSYYYSIYTKMIKSKNSYTRNINFLESTYKS